MPYKDREVAKAYFRTYRATHLEVEKARLAQFYKEHTQQMKERARLNYRTHREKYAAMAKTYVQEHKEKTDQYQHKYHQALQSTYRFRALSHYGLSCTCCGESIYEFLGIDHINGGGTKHRKSIHMNFYKWLVLNNFPSGFQTLCHNCNLAKGFYGKCPHKELGFVVAPKTHPNPSSESLPNNIRRHGKQIK